MMAPPAFLATSCDGSYDPIIVIFDPRRGLSTTENNQENLFEGPEPLDNIFIKIDDSTYEIYGCFKLIEFSEDPGIEYNVTGIFTSCGNCYFSKNVDEFQSNENINEKYETNRTTIDDIIRGKSGRS